MTAERTLAIIGAPDSFELKGVPAVLTALSPETAVRSGFDVLLARTPESRRAAQDLVRLAEEAGASVGLPRPMRRHVRTDTRFPLVNVVAGVSASLSDLVDLAIWLSGSRGVQRLELQRAGSCTALSLRGHAGQLMSIQTTRNTRAVIVTADGAGDTPLVAELPVEGLAGLRAEAARFAESPAEAVLLEDSMDVVAVLERVGKRRR